MGFEINCSFFRYENDSRDGRQENESRNPNFWAEAAAKFAAASGDFDDDNAQHADDVAPVAGAEAVPGEDDGHTIDLDTRFVKPNVRDLMLLIGQMSPISKAD